MARTTHRKPFKDTDEGRERRQQRKDRMAQKTAWLIEAQQFWKDQFPAPKQPAQRKRELAR